MDLPREFSHRPMHIRFRWWHMAFCILFLPYYYWQPMCGGEWRGGKGVQNTTECEDTVPAKFVLLTSTVIDLVRKPNTDSNCPINMGAEGSLASSTTSCLWSQWRINSAGPGYYAVTNTIQSKTKKMLQACTLFDGLISSISLKLSVSDEILKALWISSSKSNNTLLDVVNLS